MMPESRQTASAPFDERLPESVSSYKTGANGEWGDNGVNKLVAASLIVACASPLASQTSANEDQSASPVPEAGVWLTNDDYPSSRVSGAVRFVLAVDETGKIYRCDTVLSSGHPKLDELTCNLALRRRRFLPAKDKDGIPVPSETPQRIIWALPYQVPDVNPASNYDTIVQVQQLPQKKPYIEIAIREIIAADGEREHCVLEEGSGIAAFDRQACQLVAAVGNLPPLRAPDNQAIRGVRVRYIAFVAEESVP